MKVLISTSSFGAADRSPIEELERHGFEVRLNPFGRPLKEPEIAELLGDVDVLVAGTEPLTENVFERAGRLKAISRVGVGMDNVDQTSARRRGIAVFNTPDAPTDAVAELTLAGMLSLLRQVPRRDRDLRNGVWNKEMGRLLRGRTVGILGLGRIGKRVTELLKPFDVEVLACDPVLDIAWATSRAVKFVTLPEMLAASEIISVHASKPAGGGCLIGADEIAQMKRGAYVVNTGRGGLVDERALCEALRAGKLAGAFVDVFEQEPYDGPLRELPTVILTPHIGSYATEVRVRMEVEAVQNVLSWLRQAGESLHAC